LIWLLKCWGIKIITKLEELVKIHQNFRDYSNKLGKSQLKEDITKVMYFCNMKNEEMWYYRGNWKKSDNNSN